MRHDRNAAYCANSFVNIDTSYYINHTCGVREGEVREGEVRVVESSLLSGEGKDHVMSSFARSAQTFLYYSYSVTKCSVDQLRPLLQSLPTPHTH